MRDEYKYCICCGEDVPYNRVVRNEREELTCLYCGFTLDVKNLWEEHEQPVSGIAMIAEDSETTRRLIEEVIRSKGLSDEIISVEDGLKLTSEFSKIIKEGRKVEFMVIDLNMPVMDGLTAARTVRAIESGAGRDHVPIVFFSAVKADDNLKKQMGMLSPAHYMNKGSDADPEALSSRIEGLINFILTTYA